MIKATSIKKLVTSMVVAPDGKCKHREEDKSKSLHPTVLVSNAATIGREQEPDAYDHENGAVDSPLRLPGHEAARKDVDSLKNPHAAQKQTENTRDNHYDAHDFLSEWLRPRPPAARLEAPGW
jgi:hypothetical protein